jgi:hypothetical protein
MSDQPELPSDQLELPKHIPENEMPEKESGLEKIGGIVPDVFYDVIARIVPGCSLVIAIAWDERWRKKLFEGETSFGESVVFLGAGYIAGMFLTTVSFLFFDCTWQFIASYCPCVIRIFARTIERSHIKPMRLTSDMLRIGEMDAGAGKILFKSFAEISFFENMATAIAVYSVIVAYNGPSKWSWPIFVLFAVSIVSVIMRIAMFTKRVEWAKALMKMDSLTISESSGEVEKTTK